MRQLTSHESAQVIGGFSTVFFDDGFTTVLVEKGGSFDGGTVMFYDDHFCQNGTCTNVKNDTLYHLDNGIPFLAIVGLDSAAYLF